MKVLKSAALCLTHSRHLVSGSYYSNKDLSYLGPGKKVQSLRALFVLANNLDSQHGHDGSNHM